MKKKSQRKLGVHIRVCLVLRNDMPSPANVCLRRQQALDANRTARVQPACADAHLCVARVRREMGVSTRVRGWGEGGSVP